MSISEAAFKALKNQTGITRRSWGPRGMIIIPTNTISNCIIQTYRYKERLTKGWQPSADDLIADDWIPMGMLDEWD